jgi:hypothetical protein
MRLTAEAVGAFCLEIGAAAAGDGGQEVEMKRRALSPGGRSAAEHAALETIRAAIRHREQLIADHAGRTIAFCPHALAAGPDGYVLLAFLIIGDVATGTELTSPQRWRWLRVDGLKMFSRRAGGVWFTAHPGTRPPLPAGGVEVEAAA